MAAFARGRAAMVTIYTIRIAPSLIGNWPRKSNLDGRVNRKPAPMADDLAQRLAWDLVCLGMKRAARRREIQREARKDAERILRAVRKMIRRRLGHHDGR